MRNARRPVAGALRAADRPRPGGRRGRCVCRGWGTWRAPPAIRACRDSRPLGLLRVVNAGANCRTGETFLTWNVEGQAGPSGIAGPKGDSGAPEPREAPALRGARPHWAGRPAGRGRVDRTPGVDGSQGVSVYAVQPSNHCAGRGFDIYQQDSNQNDALIGPLCDGATGTAGAPGATAQREQPGAKGEPGPREQWSAGPDGQHRPTRSNRPERRPGAPRRRWIRRRPGREGRHRGLRSRGPPGPAGPQGPKGDPGADGAKGDAGRTGPERRFRPER